MIIPTIEDDLRVFGGHEAFDRRRNIVRGQMHRSRQMVLPEVRVRQHLEQMKGVAAIDLLTKLVPGDPCAASHA